MRCGGAAGSRSGAFDPLDTGAEPDEPKWVTYKTETGEYSWLEGKDGSAIGGSHEFCPEGHYDNMGFSSYHSIPMNLTLYVYGISRDGDWGAELDKTVKKRNYEQLGSRIVGKCDGETVRNYIDEFGVTLPNYSAA